MDEVGFGYYSKERRSDRMCQVQNNNALIYHLSKILLLIILERLKTALEDCLSEEQGGFRKDRGTDRGTVQQFLTLRLIAEKHLERDRPVYNCFVDYNKAFDSVWHDGLWAVLQSFRVPSCLLYTSPSPRDRQKSRMPSSA